MDHLVWYLVMATFSYAFFVGVETALIASNNMRIEIDKHNKGVISRITTFFFANSNELLAAILIWSTISLICFSLLCYQWFFFHIEVVEELNFAAVGFVILSAAVLLLVAGEFLPKTVIKFNPTVTLRALAIPLFLFFMLTYPITKLVLWLAQGLFHVLGFKADLFDAYRVFTRGDLAHFVQFNLGNNERSQEMDHEVKIFQNALDFSSIKIKECAVPRTEIKAIEYQSSVAKLTDLFITSGHSKIVVYKESLDHIVGYIHSSELFKNQDDWHAGIQQIPIAPASMAANNLMTQLMKKKRSLALVVDEYGGTEGIVSLEDLVEEIFGEIEDEYDKKSYVAHKIGDNEYILSARLEIQRVNELFELDLPESDEYATIGGLILNYHQDFPKQHEEVFLDHYCFKILKRGATKLELVRLKRVE